jgi:hypothetical protein
MSGAASLLSMLRDAGISIRSADGRLIVEAPAGLVSAEMRTEIASHKAELVATLESHIGLLPPADSVTEEAVREVSGLLAVAYQRYARIPRVRAEEPENPTLPQLALSGGVSVHGHGHTT